MAFSHLAGVTTPGAPDEIIDWFATFEAWIVSVGWTVAAGAGTTDMFLSSPGELGGLTKLFVHVWRDGVFANRVRWEVCDDAVGPLGTNHTTYDQYVDSGGVQFAWWMSADLDAICVVWKLGAGYRMHYAGLVMPFALTVTDETYCMCVTDRVGAAVSIGVILRRFDNLWDQTDLNYMSVHLRGAEVDVDDGSLPVGGIFFGDRADIAGQYRHITCEIMDLAVNPEDTLTTGQPGATTEWIVLGDRGADKFALRTGGVLPTGRTEGNFAYTTGLAATRALWGAALVAFMTANGWSDTDVSGASGNAWDHEFHSTGEDGLDDIWIRVWWLNAAWVTSMEVADSAYGTAGRHRSTGDPGGVDANFPTQYYIAGDADCICLTVNVAGVYRRSWAGRASVSAPNLSSPYMRVSIHSANNFRTLLRHDGTWDQLGVAGTYGGHGVTIANSNPNNYDGITYLVWPYHGHHAGPNYEFQGQFKYLNATHGGGIGNLDTITVGAQVYTVFFDVAAWPWAMRSA